MRRRADQFPAAGSRPHDRRDQQAIAISFIVEDGPG